LWRVGRPSRQADGQTPAIDFLNGCPIKLQARVDAALDHVAAAPLPRYSGGGRDDRDRLALCAGQLQRCAAGGLPELALRNGYLVDILRGMRKVLISVPDALLDRIDRAAKARKTTRSRFIEEAAQRELGWPAADSMDAAVKRAREALASAGPFEAADLIRRDREARDAARR